MITRTRIEYRAAARYPDGIEYGYAWDHRHGAATDAAQKTRATETWIETREVTVSPWQREGTPANQRNDRET